MSVEHYFKVAFKQEHAEMLLKSFRKVFVLLVCNFWVSILRKQPIGYLGNHSFNLPLNCFISCNYFVYIL